MPKMCIPPSCVCWASEMPAWWCQGVRAGGARGCGDCGATQLCCMWMGGAAPCEEGLLDTVVAAQAVA